MTHSGTNQGAFEDYGAPATARAASWSSVLIRRVECGKLIENQVVTDRLSELRQLGVITDEELASVEESAVATLAP